MCLTVNVFTLQSLVKEKLQSVASAVKTVLQNAGTTLKTDIQTSFPELSYIIDRISETLHEIMEYKIVKDITHLYTRTSNSSIIKHIADIIRTNLNKLRAKLDVIMSKLSDTSDKMLTKIHSWMAQLLKHLEKCENNIKLPNRSNFFHLSYLYVKLILN